MSVCAEALEKNFEECANVSGSDKQMFGAE
jgi:hypothetical protein